MRMPKPVTIKLNRKRNPVAASLRMHRVIRFDEKRHALATLQAWRDLYDWQKNLRRDEDLEDDEY